MKKFWLRQTENQRQKVLRGIKHACICVCVLLLCYLVGFTVARMITTKNNGDSTNTAKFVVTADGGASVSVLNLDCNKNIIFGDYAFSVSNFNVDNVVSEVNISYKIVVVLPQALLNGVELTISDCVREISEDKTTYEFSTTKTFVAGQKDTHSYTLRFTASKEILEDDIEMRGIEIFVNAEQAN